MTVTFVVTEPAAQKLKDLALRAGYEHPKLRIRVVSGGCSGMEYRMDFQKEPAASKDIVWEFDSGISVITDPMTALYIMNSKLVWEQTLMKQGFNLENPNVKAKCACGLSFTV